MDGDRARLIASSPAKPGVGITRVVLVGIPLCFLAIFFVYPVASIVWRGLAPEGSLDVSSFGDVFTSPRFWRIVWFTCWQAAVSTLLTLVIAMPGAHVFARYDFPGKQVMRAATTVAFVLPTVLVATAFFTLFSSGGLSRSIWAILLAHVFFNYAVVLRTVGGFWANLDPRLEEAARALGASRLHAFRTVTLPLLRPSIAAAASIVFLFTFTSFGVVLILGGLRYQTLETEIYLQTAQFLNLPVAAVLTIVQMTLVFGLLVFYTRYQRRRVVELQLRAQTETATRPRDARQWAVVIANLAVIGALIGVPLGVLVTRSFRTAAGWTTVAYRSLFDTTNSTLFVPPFEAIVNSLVFASLATFIALTIGGLASIAIAHRPGRNTRTGGVGGSLDVVLLLPLGTSAVTIGFGYLISLDRPPLDLRGSLILIPLAQALVAIPFVIRALVPVLRSIDDRLRDAATVLGASPRQIWREIDLPIVSRAGLVAAGFAFAVSIGEFGATVFLAHPSRPTIPVAIFRLLGRPGALNFAQALAMSVILMVLTGAAIIAIERIRVRGLGEF